MVLIWFILSQFKDMPKVGLDSPFFRTNLALPYPGFNGLLHPNMASTPFAAPSQIAAFTPKVISVESQAL